MTDFSPAVIDAAAEWLGEYRADADDPDGARSFLAAALGVMSPCPNCGGRNKEFEWLDVEEGEWMKQATGRPCPDHREPVHQLLLDLGPEVLWAALQAMGAVEQAGIRFEEPSMSGPRYRFTAHVRAPQNDHEIPVFRFVGRSEPERNPE